MENTFNKIIELDDAMKHFRDGMIIMFGGFGGIGTLHPLSTAFWIMDSKI